MSSDPTLFRYLVEASTDGIWLLDGEGRTLYANPRMAELLGRPPEEMVGLSAYDVHDEVGKEQFTAHLAQARAGEPGQDDLETMYLRPGGEPIWLLASWRPVRDDEGQVIGYLHRFTDYTERRELIGALREREQMLAEAQAIAGVGSWSWDVAEDEVVWSRQLYEMHGIRPEEFDRDYEAFLSLIHPGDRDQVREVVGRVFEGAADEFEWVGRVVRGDGGLRWVRGLGRAERDGEGRLVRMSGTEQDITDKVLADQEIRQATRRLALLRRVAEVANQSTGLAEALVRATTSVTELSGWEPLWVFVPAEEGPGLVPLPLGADGPAATPPGGPGLAHRELAGELAAEAERTGATTVRTAPGREQTHSLVAVPVRHGAGIAGVVVALADEAPPAASSYDLAEQLASVLGRVAERERAAAELAEARDQAMEASRMKSRFLATMSHEIRTPMNGVLGLTDLLRRTRLDEEQRRLTDALHGAGTTLRGIVDDILDLTKIEAGKLELEVVDFSVRAVLDQVVRLLAGQATEKGLELSADVAPEVPALVRGDSTRLGQVLANLGSNAVKFTDSGAVRIEVATLTSEAAHTTLLVTVADTGPGIPREAQQRLFDAFTQADPSTTRRHGGTGLGLTIARQLVGALGGRITVDSEPGRGSTFRFTARFATATSTDAEPGATTAPVVDRHRSRADRPRVLVVEDNHVNQMVAVGLLEHAGFDTVVAADGVEAVAALAPGHGFAAVLMDCRMPRLDGFAATRAIRAQEPAGQRVPIIAMTASALEGERERCLACGMDDFLTKPVDAVRVERVLRQWVRGSDRAPEPPAGELPWRSQDAVRPEAGTAVVDLDRVEMLHEMVKDGVSLFQRSSGNFIAHAPDHLDALRSAIGRSDAEALTAAAHKLKGSALNLGLPRVGHLAAALEDQGRAGHLAEAPTTYDVLAREMEQALAALADARAARA